MSTNLRGKTAGLALTSVILLGLAGCAQDEMEQQSAADEMANEMANEGGPGAVGVFHRDPVPPSPPASDLLGRGEYLVETIIGCGNCHHGRNEAGEFVEGQEYAGNFVIEEPGLLAYAPNITPDMETGIGAWTDREIERAIREGIARDGRVMGPPMAFTFYRGISSNDMAAIIAYLRSRPAVSRVVPPSEFTIPLPPNWGPPVDLPVPDVPRSDRLAYGRYLAHTLGHCTQCHTPLVNGVEDFSRIGAGMNVYPMPFHQPWSAVAANITQDETLGIGLWSDDEIKRAITQGIGINGRKLLPFMAFPFYAKISDEDLELIVEYIKTFPPSQATPPPAEE